MFSRILCDKCSYLVVIFSGASVFMRQIQICYMSNVHVHAFSRMKNCNIFTVDSGVQAASPCCRSCLRCSVVTFSTKYYSRCVHEHIYLSQKNCSFGPVVITNSVLIYVLSAHLLQTYVETYLKRY